MSPEAVFFLPGATKLSLLHVVDTTFTTSYDLRPIMTVYPYVSPHPRNIEFCSFAQHTLIELPIMETPISACRL